MFEQCYNIFGVSANDIANALGYKSSNSISNIYAGYADEFSSAMTETVNLTVSGNLQKQYESSPYAVLDKEAEIAISSTFTFAFFFNSAYIPLRGVETSNRKPDIINPVSVGFFMP
ncbi:hypothetical protein BOO23_01075 [Vibrio navarrensis]|nr:hypothetical protein [Vibrio navarrensis]